MKIHLRYLALIFSFLILYLSSGPIWANLGEHVLAREVKVARELGGSSVRTLPMGTKIKVIKEHGQWLRIRFRDRGKNHAGFIRRSDLIKSQEAEKRMPRSVYISTVYNFGWQGERDLQTTADTIYDLTTFSGTALFFELGINWPLTKEWSVFTALAQREIFLSGSAEVRNSPTGTKSEFELKQSFMGGQLGLKLTPEAMPRFSLLGMIEVAKATKVELSVVQGVPILAEDLKKPLSFIMLGGLEYRFPLGKSVYLALLGRGGSVLTTEPVILVFDTVAQLNYIF